MLLITKHFLSMAKHLDWKHFSWRRAAAFPRPHQDRITASLLILTKHIVAHFRLRASTAQSHHPPSREELSRFFVHVFSFNLSSHCVLPSYFLSSRITLFRFLLRVSRTKNNKLNSKKLSAFVLDSRPVLSMVCYIIWSSVVRMHAISLHFLTRGRVGGPFRCYSSSVVNEMALTAIFLRGLFQTVKAKDDTIRPAPCALVRHVRCAAA